MIKNACYIIEKAFFVLLRYSDFCPDFFGHIGKRLNKKAGINFIIYDVTKLEKNNYNTDIAQCHFMQKNETGKLV